MPPDRTQTVSPDGDPAATRDPDPASAAQLETHARAPADPAATPNPTAHPGGGGAAPPVVGAGRYSLGDEIARGGMGVIHRATDAVLGREVAVKVLQGRYTPDSAAAARFADEARITAQLQHPGIPPVHDLGALPDGRPFLAMKLIKGDTLDALLAARSDPAADRGRALAAFEQVCQAVAYAHAHRVIHRDLKPQNVMVGAFGEVQVMDWGLAKVLADGPPEPADPARTAAETADVSLRDSDGSYTQAGSVLGTPAFMPPEQALGAVGKVDARSDVFGLGAVLALILTGQPPFAAAGAETTRILAAQGRLDDCFDRLDGCGADPEWVGLCKRCLAADPAARPADAGEVARAVAALRADADDRARRAELDRVKADADRAAAVVQAAEQRKRRHAQAALGLAFTALVALGAVFGWWADREAARREADRRETGLRQRAEEDNRAAADRARQDRAAAEATALLDQADAALRAGRADGAAVALDAAGRRAPEGAADALPARLADLRTDLAALRDLDAADRSRWAPVQGYDPDPGRGRDAYRSAFARYAADGGDPAGLAARIGRSAIRARLVAGLDTALAAGDQAVLPVLLAVEPDRYRADVRRAVAAGDKARLTELLATPDAAGQPAGFLAAVLTDKAVPAGRRRELLEAAAHRSPGDISLLLALGYSFDPWTGGDDPARPYLRQRWFQAAAAVAPDNPSVRLNLGLALHNAGHRPAGTAEFREATRLAPTDPKAWFWLGWALQYGGDFAGGAEAIAEAVRLDPGDAMIHALLGGMLTTLGRTRDAEPHLREGLRLAPADAGAAFLLWRILRDRGETADGLPYLRVAARNSTDPTAAIELVAVLRDLGDEAGAAAAYADLRRRDPARFGPAPPAFAARLAGHTSAVYGVAYAPDGRLASCGYEGTLRVWDGRRGEAVLPAPDGQRFRSHAVRPLPGGGYQLVAGTFDGRLVVYSPAPVRGGRTGWGVTVLGPTCGKAVNALAVHPNGRHLLAGLGDPDPAGLQVWDLDTGTRVRAYPTPGVFGIAVHPAGTRAAVTTVGGRLDLWDLATWTARPVADLTALDGVAYSPDGRVVAVAEYAGGVRLVNPATGAPTRSLVGHTEVVVGLAFAPGGRVLASGSHDRTVRLWDVRTGELLHTFDGHTAYVRQVAFGPDGRTVASASWDGSVGLWEVPPHVRPLIPTTRPAAPPPRAVAR